MQCIGAGGVPLPAKAHDGESVAQEPCVSGVRREILIATVDQGKNASVPAVGDFQQHGAVALVRIFGTDGNEVGREFDLAVF